MTLGRSTPPHPGRYKAASSSKSTDTEARRSARRRSREHRHRTPAKQDRPRHTAHAVKATPTATGNCPTPTEGTCRRSTSRTNRAPAPQPRPPMTPQQVEGSSAAGGAQAPQRHAKPSLGGPPDPQGRRQQAGPGHRPVRLVARSTTVASYDVRAGQAGMIGRRSDRCSRVPACSCVERRAGRAHAGPARFPGIVRPARGGTRRCGHTGPRHLHKPAARHRHG